MRGWAGPPRAAPIAAAAPASSTSASTTSTATTRRRVTRSRAVTEGTPRRYLTTAPGSVRSDRWPARWSDCGSNRGSDCWSNLRGVLDPRVAGEERPDQFPPAGEAVGLAESLGVRLEGVPLDEQYERRRRLDAADHPGVAEPRRGGGQWQRLPVRGGEVVLAAGLNGELCYLQDHALIMGGCAGSRDSVCWEPRLGVLGAPTRCAGS